MKAKFFDTAANQMLNEDLIINQIRNVKPGDIIDAICCGDAYDHLFLMAATAITDGEFCRHSLVDLFNDALWKCAAHLAAKKEFGDAYNLEEVDDDVTDDDFEVPHDHGRDLDKDRLQSLMITNGLRWP